jgi:hypothetical protein
LGPWQLLVFALKQDVFIVIAQHVPQFILLRVWGKNVRVVEAEFRRLRSNYLREREPRDDANRAEFFVVVLRMGEPHVRIVTTTPRVRRANELTLHYGGDDFLEWHLDLIVQLKTKVSGLTLLQGSPGVGKTSYIRALMAELRRSHKFYFLPVSAFSLLASPACLDFWMGESEQHQGFGKIVVIEDAENLLLPRATDNQESVSNLLNTADGFLSDALKLHVLCTINTRLDTLDPAVIRPGRLIAAREFRRLTPAEAQRIAHQHELTLHPQESYSLGEIYNNSRHEISGAKPVGFADVR